MTYDPNNNIYTNSPPPGKQPLHPCLIVLLVVVGVIAVGFLLLFGFCFFAMSRS